MTKKKYKRSSVAEVLNNRGLTMKSFAEWLGMTEQGLSRAMKKEDDGLSIKWQWCLYGFLMEQSGFKLEHEIFND